jgi:hypothetical protein
MGKKSNEFLEYHLLVLRTTFSASISDLFGDIKSIIGDFIIAIGTGLAYAIWLYFRENGIIDWLGILISVLCGFALWGFLVFFCNLIWRTPERIYRNEKMKADKLNWNGVGVSCEKVLKGNQVVAHRVKVENNKIDTCYFLVRLQYLSLDGVTKDYKEANKSRVLLWVSNDNTAKKYGFGLEPKYRNNSKSFCFFELLCVSENVHGKKYSIVFCEHSENDSSKLAMQYARFSRFAEGELKFRGTYLAPSFSTGHVGSGGYNPTIIPEAEELVYKFRFEIENDEPKMAIFENGFFEFHNELEDNNSNETKRKTPAPQKP